MRATSRKIALALIVLVLLAALAVYAAAREDRGGALTVSFLDVGQGDAILIDAPSGRQVLIDGGSGPAAVREISKKLPWWDRSIDIIIATHPDADHIGGLIDVFGRYAVAHLLASAVEGDTAIAEAFESAQERSGAAVTLARRGQVVDLGGGAYLEVLLPDRPLPRAETNTACTVLRLVYGQTAFMLSCDAPRAMEEYLARLDGEALRSNVLKAGHHGSKTSSAPLFLGFVGSQYGVYSRGCDNAYGHPNKETITTFARFDIPTLDTCADGTITFVSDGVRVSRK